MTPPTIKTAASPTAAPPTAVSPTAAPPTAAPPTTGVRTLHQSDLKTWMACPLRWRYQHVDNLAREQSASLTFGSIMHEAVMRMEMSEDLDAAITFFLDSWDDPKSLDPRYVIDYYVRSTNFKKYRELGQRILRDWWSIAQWNSDIVLAREYFFDVPIGTRGNRLAGTIDKIVLRHDAATGSYSVVIIDYKTNSKVPTYEWLEDDLQFTAYALASLDRGFWANMTDGAILADATATLPRRGEWVSLQTNKRMDAGERGPQQYHRLIAMVDAMAESIEQKIFVPTISGESCRWCEFRAQCGLRPIED